ncbi:circularly permuted type 2 ATP-grasp protein [bacterium]|nr:circularly permuted type 2 ATP-grasp protein [candidate division CSSED10-310 bacterium]
MESSNMTAVLEKKFRNLMTELDDPPGMIVRDIEDMNYYLEKRRALARGKVLPTFIKPYFLTVDRISEYANVVRILLGCQEKLIHMYYEVPEYRPMYELTEDEKPLVEIGGPLFRHIYFSRMDSIVPDDGDYKFLEFNCDSPGGAYYSDIQWEALAKMEIFKRLNQNYIFRYEPYRPRVLKALLSAWKDAGKSGNPSIAVMGNPDVTNVEEFRLFAELFQEEGYQAIFTDPWTCEYDGTVLRKGDHPIDLIYRRGVLGDYSRHPAEAKPVIDAYRDGNVIFANPLSSKLGDNKNLLEVMTDESTEWLFTPEERVILRKHLPWTRIMKEGKTTHQGRKVDLAEYIRRNRRLFVLKPNAEYGGKGVVIGRDVDLGIWENAIETALKTPYVVQEYVKIPEQEFPVVRDDRIVWEPKKINVNFFTFAGDFGGGFCRTSDSSVINISAGGALVSFCVVESGR